MIPHEHVDALARATYVRNADLRGTDITAWERMGAAEREANLDSARFAPTVLAALGLTIVTGDRAQRRRGLTLEELEAGARLEHLRWCRFTRRIGRVEHPDLVPWEDLDEATRELDRVRIRALPELLSELGYSVIDDDGDA